MAALTINDDSTRDEIAEAIQHLREKQRRCVIPSTAAEVGSVIDHLLEEWASKPET